MFTQKGIFAVLLAVISMVMISYRATAESQYNKTHPRVHEVNKRLKNQRNRVKQGEANGTLTKQQGNQINREDNRINQEKKDMMANDGGHLTKSDQRALNQQENHV